MATKTNEKTYTFEGGVKYLPYVGGNIVLSKECEIDFDDGKGPQHFDDSIKYTAQNGKLYKISPAAIRAICKLERENKHFQAMLALIEQQEAR